MKVNLEADGPHVYIRDLSNNKIEDFDLEPDNFPDLLSLYVPFPARLPGADAPSI